MSLTLIAAEASESKNQDEKTVLAETDADADKQEPLDEVSEVSVAADSSLGPDEVENIMQRDRAEKAMFTSRLLSRPKAWRDAFAKRTGLRLGADYTVLSMQVNKSPAADSAINGIFRGYGSWALLGKDGPNTGSLRFKLEHRHGYSSSDVSDLGFNSGYIGHYNPVFSNEKGRVTTLHWFQKLDGGKASAIVGFMDVNDYIDVYSLSSPWTGFSNTVFSTGAGTMDIPDDAALGFAIGSAIEEKFYAQFGMVDANADPTDFLDGFDTFFDERDYFTWLELGWAGSTAGVEVEVDGDGVGVGVERGQQDSAHVTLWHIDNRIAGAANGWGANVSFQRIVSERSLYFVRAGHANDSGSILQWSVNAGYAHEVLPNQGPLAVALSFGKPNEKSFGDTDRQTAIEAFWRFNVTTEIQVTPDIQFIHNPAQTNESSIIAYGLRVRMAW